MEKETTPHSLSLRLNRRLPDRNSSKSNHTIYTNFLSPFSRTSQDHSLKLLWKKPLTHLTFVLVIIWMALILIVLSFHIWSCQSSMPFFSAMCNRDSKVFYILDTIGILPKPPHRCAIPVVDRVDRVAIPKSGTPDKIVKKLVYLAEDDVTSNGTPLFGGHQTWVQREDSFKLNSTMKVHCGFMRNGGADMEPADVKYVKKCKFVVASGIFDGYDTPHQPSNISRRSQKLFCFLMVVDDVSFNFIKGNMTVRVASDGGTWVGIWRLIVLHHSPYDEPRRNGKVPKIITHRLFPQAQYSIWIDGKMELIVDPLLLLERYLWRGSNTFAIARHKHHQSIYEEADAIKRRKRYARPLIDLHMKIYKYEGMEPWTLRKKTISDVPEGAVIIREHTAMTNLFSCLWFNEVNLFTPRDQLSFGYVVYRLGDSFKFLMFPNCEYNSIFLLHGHNREHSSKIEWAKTLKELEKLKETRGGLGLWTPYPGDLDSVELPSVVRASPAG